MSEDESAGFVTADEDAIGGKANAPRQSGLNDAAGAPAVGDRPGASEDVDRDRKQTDPPPSTAGLRGMMGRLGLSR